jgi:hypothetical protein
MTQVHYSSDGELSATMELDTLIENLSGYNRKCFHGDAIDLVGLRQAIKSGREFSGYHDFGRFVVRRV